MASFALALIIGVAVYFVLQAPRAHLPPSGAPIPVSVIAHPQVEAGHQHDHEDRLEALAQQPAKFKLFDHASAHFERPSMRDADHFIAEATVPEIDASCASRSSKPDVGRALEQQLREDFAVAAELRVPEQVFFEDLTQFFRINDRYFQFTARALTGSRPPRYSLELYSAGDAMMSQQLLREQIPVPSPAQLDAPAVADLLEALRSHYLNADWGARLLQVRIPGLQDGEDQEIRFVNGTAAQWAFGGGLCQLTEDRKRALCRCLPEGETLPIPQS